jgi:hypothetical protein
MTRWWDVNAAAPKRRTPHGPPSQRARVPASRRLAHFAVDAVAAVRLTQLVVSDQITDPIRQKIWDKHPVESGSGYLISCPYCSSMYVAALVMAARRLAPGVWQPVAEGLTVAAIAGETAARLSH